ncbi:12532_t:CDS:2, partial [Dentiscutata heterogama]
APIGGVLIISSFKFLAPIGDVLGTSFFRSWYIWNILFVLFSCEYITLGIFWKCIYCAAFL